MDPLSALGIGTSVLQFLDFASKKCQAVERIYHNGNKAMLDKLAIDNSARDFLDFSALLGERRAHDAGNLSDNPNIVAIDKLVTNCSRVAQDLSNIFVEFERIRNQGHSPSKLIGYMRAAWKHEEILHLSEQLKIYQNQLTLRMLEHLNSSTITRDMLQNERFDTLEQNHSKILGVLAVSEDKLEQVFRLGKSMGRLIEDSEKRGAVHAEKTLAAILTLQNGDTRFITSPSANPFALGKGAQKLMTIKAQSEVDPAQACLQDFKPIQDEVLRSLYFPQYGDRFESVKYAHVETYEWIFSRQIDECLPWSPFIEWLEHGHGCYWINEKAGSGKSTLMKFILQNPRTKTALGTWAGVSNPEYILASFFFWNLGSELQKSQEGLLRSLLYDILHQNPSLISVVMPELWLTGATRPINEMLAVVSHNKLARWFQRLLGQATPRFRLFFLIDGIDEYEGDYLDLINLLLSVSSNENVKFLLSSRPIPACVDAFGNFPTLRLQDLTKNDIHRYAEDHLKDRFQLRYGSEWERVMDQIAEKSCGVFLWVVLVVRSLLTGLQNWDNLEELTDRLNELPSDLEDLYAAMLKRMPQAYRQQASVLFQICLLALRSDHVEEREGQQLTPIQLHFAQMNDKDVLEAPVELVAVKKEAEISHEIEGRLRSRCAGLLEICSLNFRMTSIRSSGIVQHKYVEFIHRTAVEFLQLPEVLNDMQKLTEQTSFHPAISLCRSCLMACKTAEMDMDLSTSAVWYYAARAIHYAKDAEVSAHPVPSAYLKELDRMMSRRWKLYSRWTLPPNHLEQFNHNISQRWRPNRKFRIDDPNVLYTKELHWACAYIFLSKTFSSKSPARRYLPNATDPLSFHSIAVVHGLKDFLHDYPPNLEREISNAGVFTSQASRLLIDVIRYTSPTTSGLHEMYPTYIEIAEILLNSGADPNDRIRSESYSAWELVLDYAASQIEVRTQFQQDFLGHRSAYLFSKLLLAFINSGADVNATIKNQIDLVFVGQVGVTDVSALTIIGLLYSSIRKDTQIFEFSKLPQTSQDLRDEELIRFQNSLITLLVSKGATESVGTSSVLPPPQHHDKAYISSVWRKLQRKLRFDKKDRK